MNASAELLKELRIERNAPPPPSSSRPKWWVLVPVVAAVAAAAFWFGAGRTSAVEVQTAPVVAMTNTTASASVLDASGYVVARRMATVSAKVTGRVLEVLIEEGMRVEEGQVMARLDPVDADAQFTLAGAQLAAARSQMDSLMAQVRQAEAEATRMAALIERKLVSTSQYDAAVAQRDTLRAQYVTAQRNAKVAADSLEIARNGVDNTIVRAPFAGVVIAKAAQPGEIVSPLATGGYTRTGIGTIVDMGSLEVEVDVGESYIGRVQPGMPVEAVLNAYPDWKIPAEVIAIIPAADRGKATVKVRVALHDRDSRIVPEMGVRVSFLDAGRVEEPEQQSPRGVRVPKRAIVQRDGRSQVFIVQDGKVALRDVEVGSALGDGRQVLSGIAAGQIVVLDAPAELKDGDAVRIALP
ncbi:efflux RND transporter periplasmic adaptor subunit [Xanthomonadaceae bacterium JHOS43]|nr:efflux RND transporter periplasmic adaptor subunit [Xanthomonadaceae bacterium JHOS43]